jgi:hypothetical protein
MEQAEIVKCAAASTMLGALVGKHSLNMYDEAAPTTFCPEPVGPFEAAGGAACDTDTDTDTGRLATDAVVSRICWSDIEL